MRVIRYNLESIAKHPYIGNGGLLIRDPGASPDLHAAAYGADLGYIHVVKFMGIPGLIWMISLIIVYYSILVRKLNEPDADVVAIKYSGYLFTFVLIAEVTLNFFMDPWRILVLCFALAVLITSDKNEKQVYA